MDYKISYIKGKNGDIFIRADSVLFLILDNISRTSQEEDLLTLNNLKEDFIKMVNSIEKKGINK
jgi:hypothetical protein